VACKELVDMSKAKLEKPFRNKVTGHGIMSVEDLAANPLNWRTHGDAQKQALAGAIDDVGYIRSVTFNKTTGHVLDGHLRVKLALESGVKELPVEFVELSPDDEAKALLTLDPIGAMAGADKANMESLLQMVNSDDERMQELLESIRNTISLPTPGAWDTAVSGLPSEDRAPFQQMTFTLHDTQAETVKEALSLSKSLGSFDGTENENSNGNALARICELFVGQNGNG
jgi:ParB-like chromosome segregation protein Spo0J